MHKYALILIGLISPAFGLEFTGKIGGIHNQFTDKTERTTQQNQYETVFIEPSIFYAFNDRNELKGTIYFQQVKDENSHNDVREFSWYHYSDTWEIQAGISKVFWGVTESRHLVDTINQFDNLQTDSDNKLGALMLAFKWIQDFGTVDLFYLPKFREQSFVRSTMRPSSPTKIETNAAIYQSKDGKNTDGFALRYSHSIGNLDVGLSYYDGIKKEPILNPNTNGNLTPVYVNTNQWGLDLQYIALKSLLLKLEFLSRKSYLPKLPSQNAGKLTCQSTDASCQTQINGFEAYQSKAMVAGLEFTWHGILGSRMDLGVIGEYLSDDWQDATIFQKDWFTGLRLSFNDVQSAEMLIGSIRDLDNSALSNRLEFTRRLYENFKMYLTANWVNSAENDAILKHLEKDDRVEFKIEYYY